LRSALFPSWVKISKALTHSAAERPASPKALVVTVYERDERRLDWIIESDLGHRPNRNPTVADDSIILSAFPAPADHSFRGLPSREPAPG
jgi:hypothetical protein